MRYPFYINYKASKTQIIEKRDESGCGVQTTHEASLGYASLVVIKINVTGSLASQLSN